MTNRITEILANARVVDGDTFYEGEGADEKGYRLKGFNTPEIKQAQPNAEAGKNIISDIIRNGGSINPTGEFDNYGREITEMRDKDGRNIAVDMIASGMATPTMFSNRNELNAEHTGHIREYLTGRRSVNDTIHNYAQNKQSFESMLMAIGERVHSKQRGLIDNRGTFETSWDRGVDDVRMSLGGAINYLGDRLDSDVMRDYGRELFTDAQRENVHNEREIETFSDIGKDGQFFEDILTYGVETVGEMLPGAIGDVGAIALSGGTALPSIAAKRIAGKAATRALAKRMATGAGLSAGLQGLGQMEANLEAQGSEDNPVAPLAQGLITGAMTRLPVGVVLDKVLGTLDEKAAKTVGEKIISGFKMAGLGGAVELPTSFVESLSSQIIDKIALNKDTDLDYDTIMDDALRGMFGGAMFGGGSYAMANGVKFAYNKAKEHAQWDGWERDEEGNIKKFETQVETINGVEVSDADIKAMDDAINAGTYDPKESGASEKYWGRKGEQDKRFNERYGAQTSDFPNLGDKFESIDRIIRPDGETPITLKEVRQKIEDGLLSEEELTRYLADDIVGVDNQLVTEYDGDAKLGWLGKTFDTLVEKVGSNELKLDSETLRVLNKAHKERTVENVEAAIKSVSPKLLSFARKKAQKMNVDSTYRLFREPYTRKQAKKPDTLTETPDERVKPTTTEPVKAVKTTGQEEKTIANVRLKHNERVQGKLDKFNALVAEKGEGAPNVATANKNIERVVKAERWEDIEDLAYELLPDEFDRKAIEGQFKPAKVEPKKRKYVKQADKGKLPTWKEGEVDKTDKRKELPQKKKQELYLKARQKLPEVILDKALDSLTTKKRSKKPLTLPNLVKKVRKYAKEGDAEMTAWLSTMETASKKGASVEQINKAKEAVANAREKVELLELDSDKVLLSESEVQEQQDNTNSSNIDGLDDGILQDAQNQDELSIVDDYDVSSEEVDSPEVREVKSQLNEGQSQDRYIEDLHSPHISERERTANRQGFVKKIQDLTVQLKSVLSEHIEARHAEGKRKAAKAAKAKGGEKAQTVNDIVESFPLEVTDDQMKWFLDAVMDNYLPDYDAKTRPSMDESKGSHPNRVARNTDAIQNEGNGERPARVIDERSLEKLAEAFQSSDFDKIVRMLRERSLFPEGNPIGRMGKRTLETEIIQHVRATNAKLRNKQLEKSEVVMTPRGYVEITKIAEFGLTAENQGLGKDGENLDGTRNTIDGILKQDEKGLEGRLSRAVLEAFYDGMGVLFDYGYGISLSDISKDAVIFKTEGRSQFKNITLRKIKTQIGNAERFKAKKDAEAKAQRDENVEYESAYKREVGDDDKDGYGTGRGDWLDADDVSDPIYQFSDNKRILDYGEGEGLYSGMEDDLGSGDKTQGRSFAIRSIKGYEQTKYVGRLDLDAGRIILEQEKNKVEANADSDLSIPRAKEGDSLSQDKDDGRVARIEELISNLGRQYRLVKRSEGSLTPEQKHEQLQAIETELRELRNELRNTPITDRRIVVKPKDKKEPKAKAQPEKSVFQYILEQVGSGRAEAIHNKVKRLKGLRNLLNKQNIIVKKYKNKSNTARQERLQKQVDTLRQELIDTGINISRVLGKRNDNRSKFFKESKRIEELAQVRIRKNAAIARFKLLRKRAIENPNTKAHTDADNFLDDALKTQVANAKLDADVKAKAEEKRRNQQRRENDWYDNRIKEIKALLKATTAKKDGSGRVQKVQGEAREKLAKELSDIEAMKERGQKHASIMRDKAKKLKRKTLPSKTASGDNDSPKVPKEKQMITVFKRKRKQAPKVIMRFLEMINTRLDRIHPDIAFLAKRFNLDSQMKAEQFVNMMKMIGDNDAIQKGYDDLIEGVDSKEAKDYLGWVEEVDRYVLEHDKSHKPRKGVVAQLNTIAIEKDRAGFLEIIKKTNIKDPHMYLEHVLSGEGTPEFAVDATPYKTGRSRLSQLDSVMSELSSAGFIDRDAPRGLVHYAYSASQWGTWNAYFAKDGDANGIYDALKEEVHPANLGELNKLMAGVTGKNAIGINPYLTKFNSAALAFQTATVLWFTAVASIPEVAGIISSNKGDLNNLGKDLKSAFGRAGRQEMELLASDLNIVSTQTTEHALQRLYSMDALTTGRVSQKITSTVFKYNGQQILTHAMRVLATQSATRFIEHHANSDAPVSKRMLAELGIDRDTVKAYRERPDTNSKAGRAYRDAVHRFVNQSVTNPHASQLPLIATDPRFAVFTSLKKFFYGFYDNVHKSIYREHKSGKANGDSQALQTMLAVGMTLLPLALMAELLREFIKYPLGNPRGERTMSQLMRDTLFATGGLGPMSMAQLPYEMSEYGKNPAVVLAGPTASYFVDLAAGDVTFERHVPIASQIPWARKAVRDTRQEIFNADPD